MPPALGNAGIDADDVRVKGDGRPGRCAVHEYALSGV